MKNEIKKSELKEIREAIKEYAESITDRQISFGEYIGVVGTKYVEIINCHEKTTTEKVNIEEFYGMILGGCEKTFTECYFNYKQKQNEQY